MFLENIVMLELVIMILVESKINNLLLVIVILIKEKKDRLFQNENRLDFFKLDLLFLVVLDIIKNYTLFNKDVLIDYLGEKVD